MILLCKDTRKYKETRPESSVDSGKERPSRPLCKGTPFNQAPAPIMVEPGGLPRYCLKSAVTTFVHRCCIEGPAEKPVFALKL